MTKYILTALLLALLVRPTCAQTDPSFEGADKALQAYFAEKHTVGVAVGISKNGKTVFTDNRGSADAEGEIPFTPTTLNRTASIAKPMTAVAIMQLWEQGKIDLDTPIQTYLPDFPKKEKGDLTIRNLLAQRSGIDGYRNPKKEAENKEEFPNLAAAVDVIKNRELRKEPNSTFFYSTYNYLLLGLVIEKVSGQNYEAYMQENIWDKAGMNNTGVEHFDGVYENKSELFHCGKKKPKKRPQNNLSNRIPGGGFYSTVEDLLKFGNALMDGLLIKEETLELMTQNHTPNKVGNPYGFGFFLYGQMEDPGSAIGHGGEQTGTSSHLMIVPAEGVVCAVMSNTSGNLDKATMLNVQMLQSTRKE